MDFRANEPESYRLYSLAMKGDNAAADGSTNIECYNYLNKAVSLARGVAKRVVNKLYTDYKNVGAASAITGTFKQDTMQAFVDSIITYYRDDYAYLTIQPVNAEGDLTTVGGTTDVYAKVTIPEMPASADGLYQYFKVNWNQAQTDDAQKITDPDLWTFAKKYVLERIHAKWGSDESKKDFIGYVDRNFMDIKVNTTYYLTADNDGKGGFGYCEEKDLASNADYAVWTLALTDPDKAAQVRKTGHIQSDYSKKYVQVKGEFDAEPDYNMAFDECANVAEDDEAHNKTHITVKMSRFTSEGMADATVNDNLYQISTLLSNDGQDVQGDYMQKIRRKVVNYMYQNSNQIASSVAKSFAQLYKGRTEAEQTALLQNDVKMATDIICREYLKLKVRNVNGKYMLYFDFPAVPDIIGVFENSSDKEAGKAKFWETVKKGLLAAVKDVSERHSVDVEKVTRNLDKVSPNHTYILTVDDANTFDFDSCAYRSAYSVNATSKMLWNISSISEKTDVADLTPATMKAGKAPISGKFTIQNKKTQKYVEVKSKYYARPDVAQTEASQIYVGVGPKNDNDTLSYRLYSLGTDQAKDGTTGIECYDYLDKAIGWAYGIAKTVANNQTTFSDKATLEALADSVINYYRDDYAYLSIQPVEGQKAISKAGETTAVYAKATIPAVPEIAQQLYKKFYYKEDQDMHTSLWEEAKQLVLDKLNEKYGKDANKTDVMGYINRNLMNIRSNTTYFLTADEDPVGGFDYCKASEVLDKGDLAIWNMTMVEPDEDAQKIGTFHIQNVGTEKFVAVDNSKKFNAEPNYVFDPVDLANVDSEVFKAHAKSGTHIYVDYRRFDRNDKTHYQMSELSEGGQDVNRYLWTIHNLAVEAMKKFGENYRTQINSISQVFTGSNDDAVNKPLTDKFINDAMMATDMVAREYLKLKIRDNGDGTVSLYHEFPTVPAVLDQFAKQKLGKDLWTYLKGYIKETLDDQNNHYSKDYPDAVAKIERNIENVNPGHTYFLTAETDDTFGYTFENTTQDVAKWGLTNADDELNAPAIPMTEEEMAKEGVKPIDGFFHISSGYDVDNSIVQVTDYCWAGPYLSKADAKTLPGSVIYVKAEPVKRNGILQYKLTNLRSQGIEVNGETEKTYTEFYNALKEGKLDSQLRTIATQGYTAWLSTGMKAFLYGIGRHLDDKTNETAGDNSSLADKFIKAVDGAFDDAMYIMPTTLKDGETKSYYMYEKTMNLEAVSKFYAENKEAVDKAIKSVSAILKNNSVPTDGESFTGSGYLANMGYTGTMPTTISYSSILSDPELLFYWLKMEVVNMLDKSNATTAGNYKNAVAALLTDDADAKSNITGFIEGLQNIYVGNDLGNLIANYFKRINYSRFYYLLDGWFNNGQGGEGKPSNPGIFGFGNNNDYSSYYGSELKRAEDAGKWVMTELNADNKADCFGLGINSTLQGLDGHYYGTMYVDFPIDVTASKTETNGLRFYYVNSEKTEPFELEQADGTKKTVQTVTLGEYTDVVPSGAAVIVESKSYNADDNKMVPKVAYDVKPQGGDMLKGSFFPVGKTRVYDNSSSTYGSTQKNLGQVVYEFLNLIFGVTDYDASASTYKADASPSRWVASQLDKMLGIEIGENDRTYTLWKGKTDPRNPMGFYIYRDKTQTGETARNQFKALDANKAFLYVKNAMSATGGAKIYIGGFNGGTTGIGEIVAPADQQKNVIYDLQGRRVNNPHHGIYIINGKKVLIVK